MGYLSLHSTTLRHHQHFQRAALTFFVSYPTLIQAAAPLLIEGTGVEPLFPIWTTAQDTPALARRMLAADLGAVLTCVDPKQLSESFVGRLYDEKLLADLPAGVDPCGERGEFHTFCFRCPEFCTEIPVTIGNVVEREGFWFADLRPTETTCGMTPG